MHAGNVPLGTRLRWGLPAPPSPSTRLPSCRKLCPGRKRCRWIFHHVTVSGLDVTDDLDLVLVHRLLARDVHVYGALSRARSPATLGNSAAPAGRMGGAQHHRTPLVTTASELAAPRLVTPPPHNHLAVLGGGEPGKGITGDQIPLRVPHRLHCFHTVRGSAHGEDGKGVENGVENGVEKGGKGWKIFHSVCLTT